MDVLEKFQELKRREESLKQRISRAEGAIEQHKARLKQEFGCSSIEQARNKLAHLEKETEEAEAAFQQAVEEFEEKWGDTLS